MENNTDRTEPPGELSASLEDKLLPVGCYGVVLVVVLVFVGLVVVLPQIRSSNRVEPGPDDPFKTLLTRPAGLYLFEDDGPRSLASGEAIPIAGGVLVQATMARSSPGRFARQLDLVLQRGSAGTPPVEDAVVRLDGSMGGMSHGSFRETAMPSGNGHYLLPLPFAMLGVWQLDLEIETPETHTSLQLAVVLKD